MRKPKSWIGPGKKFKCHVGPGGYQVSCLPCCKTGKLFPYTIYGGRNWTGIKRMVAFCWRHRLCRQPDRFPREEILKMFRAADDFCVQCEKLAKQEGILPEDLQLLQEAILRLGKAGYSIEKGEWVTGEEASDGPA